MNAAPRINKPAPTEAIDNTQHDITSAIAKRAGGISHSRNGKNPRVVSKSTKLKYPRHNSVKRISQYKHS